MGRALETGGRVYLRRLRPADQEELCLLRRSSSSFLAPWEPGDAVEEAPYDPRWFAELLASARRRNYDRTVLCRRPDGAILGMVGLNEIVRGHLQSAFAGYWIGAEHARGGYMTEGLELLLRHAFGRVGLHRVEANIQPGNSASLALVRKLGFRHEGLAKRYLRIDGKWRDHERWALTIEDWSERPH